MRRTIVRFQIILLVLAVGLIGYRILDGTPAPSGTLVLHGIEEDHIEARTLRVSGEPQRFAIDAAGSFASPDARRLEAYAWILDRDSREVVWQMTPARATRTRGTVAEQRDTVTLGPGTYDAFFTSYGSGERPTSSGIFSTSRRWRNNAPHWKLVIQALGDAAFAQGSTRNWGGDDWDDARPAPDGLVWTSAPDGDDEATGTLLVRTPAAVEVYAVGALQPTEKSPLHITPVGGSTPVWTLPVAESEAAGGNRQNRQYRGTFTLSPGLYEVRYDPDRDWGRWQANPPFDPAAWGVTLSTATPDAVARFEPFETADPAVAISQPGDGVDRSVDFRVARRTPVLVYAMGEMQSSTNRYDYGWIEDAASGRRVWEMEYDETRRAGGDGKNRVAEAWITLDPGAYTLRYKSDGSHSYGDFNTSPPDHDERWGIALFAADEAALVAGQTADLGGQDPEGAWGEEASDARFRIESRRNELEAPPSVDGAVVALTRSGSNEDVSADFEVRRPAEYRLYATGEVSGTQQYDYARLLDENGTVLWEMTGDATVAAGGAARNRTFDATVHLEPGRYTLHYQSDASHDYDSFSPGDAPTYPNAWGVILRALDR